MSYGCHNQPRPTAGAITHWAQEGFEHRPLNWGNIDRLPIWKPIHHVMTTACQYTKQHAADPGCAGCQHQSNKEPS